MVTFKVLTGAIIFSMKVNIKAVCSEKKRKGSKNTQYFHNYLW